MKSSSPNIRWSLGRESWLGMPLVLEAGFEVIRRAMESWRGWHTHEGFEMDCVLEGRLDFSFGGNESLIVPGGHFILIPPRRRHEVYQNLVTPCRVFWIAFAPGAARSCRHTPFPSEFLRKTRQRLLDAGTRPRRAGKEIVWTIEQLHRLMVATEAAPTDSLATQEIRLLFSHLYLQTLRRLESEEPPQASGIVERTRRFMEENVGARTDISCIAREMGISRSHLSRAFAREVGYTPADYLRRLRCAKAKELLLATALPVTRIALDLGFSSSQRFAEIFKTYTGMSPTACRQRAVRFVLPHLCAGTER
ncbi:MAG: AraC family transcriptional regulator [Kiritimatiellae bacterium]|nr:AraC family transcriptional regulator [Kiritimatiellia bacterium]